MNNKIEVNSTNQHEGITSGCVDLDRKNLEKEKDSIKENIIYQEMLGEVAVKSYQRVQISRVKYKENSHMMLDIRMYNRGWDDEENEKYHPTKKGIQLREDLFLNLVKSSFRQHFYQQAIVESESIIEKLFHPEILNTLELITTSNRSLAVFQAFKKIEIKIRKLGKFPNEIVGVDLVRKAFSQDTGILVNCDLPLAEKEAISHIFAGAIGLFKNPHSHREVDITTEETLESVILASMLLKHLDRIENMTKGT